VRDQLERHKADLWVLDTVSVLSGVDLNDNAGAAEFMGWVGDVANSLDLVATVILHENKAAAYAGRSLAAARQAVLGAGQWRAQCHTLISLELPNDPRDTEETPEGSLDTWTVRVQLPKEREFGDGPDIQGLVKKSLKSDGVLRRMWIELDAQAPAPRRASAKERMIEALVNGPLSRPDWAAATGMKPSGGGFNRYVRELEKDGCVVKLEDGSYTLQ
jgi:hypothetical protein